MSFSNISFKIIFFSFFILLIISCGSKDKKVKTLDSDPIETITQKENCLQGKWIQEGKESDMSYWELDVRKNDASNEWGEIGRAHV